MSTSTHPITILSDSDIEDDFSSTHSLDYILASPDYFLAPSGNTFSDPSEDLSKYLLALLAILPFHDDPYMKVMQAYNATSNESHILPLRAPIAPPTIAFIFKTELQEARTEIAGFQREQMGHNDETVLARVRISTIEMIIEDIQILILCCLVNVDRMAPKRTSTSAASAMTQLAIKKLVADSVAVALEAQAATMANTDNTDRNIGQRETHEFAVLGPTMVPNSEKLMEVFIKGLPRSIEGNVITLKPQTLEEAITIT
nr:reverse transcriptase domain-containing protein [Tanacetum cinerariifolium]